MVQREEASRFTEGDTDEGKYERQYRRRDLVETRPRTSSAGGIRHQIENVTRARKKYSRLLERDGQNGRIRSQGHGET